MRKFRFTIKFNDYLMAFNKNKTVSWRRYYDNLLTPSWVAGNNHSRSALSNFKRDEIEAIDINGLCDHLRSCIMKTRNLGAINSNQKSKPLLPFKVVSRMVFGTLLIFREQVNNLLEDTERSLQHNNHTKDYNYDYCRTQTTRKSLKRRTLSSSCSKPCEVPIVKKQRLTPERFNYTQLLSEADLFPLTTSSDLTYDEAITCTESYSIVRKGDQLQMREIQITVRELNVDQMSPTDYLEQQDFGNATTEELDELIDLFPDKSTGLNFLKRKLILEREHSSAKVANIDSDPIVYNVNYDNCIASDRDSKSKDELPLTGNIPEQNFNTSYQDNALEDLVTNTTTGLHNETLRAQSPSLPQFKFSPVLVAKQLRKKKNTKPKPVTDKRNKLNRNQHRAQLEKYYKDIANRPKPTVPHKQGSELLQTFKLKHIFPDILLKQNKPSAENMREQYTNLLRNIFGHGYNEEIEIYMIPNESTVALRRRERKQTTTITTPAVRISQETIGYLQNSENMTTIVNFDIDKCNNNANNNESPPEYTVYGTMMRLLDTWRNQDSDIEKIDAHAFLHKHRNRILAALTYHNLLELTRDLFIILTTKPNSIEIANILLGSKSEELISELII